MKMNRIRNKKEFASEVLSTLKHNLTQWQLDVLHLGLKFEVHNGKRNDNYYYVLLKMKLRAIKEGTKVFIL